MNMSVELQSLTLSIFLAGLRDVKSLEMEGDPHVGVTVQVMTLPLLVHWYEATSLEHTAPGPTSCVD